MKLSSKECADGPQPLPESPINPTRIGAVMIAGFHVVNTLVTSKRKVVKKHKSKCSFQVDDLLIRPFNPPELAEILNNTAGLSYIDSSLETF